MSLPFTPRLEPIDYQAEYLRDHGRDPAWGLFWHQGAGKTKALIDNTALLFCEGLVDGLLALAPNGVHRAWQTDELPKHWPHDTPLPYEAFVWDTAKAVTQKFQRAFQDFLAMTQPGPGQHYFGVLCLSYDGLMTDAGKKASWDFLRKRRCMYVADESQRFKTPASNRNIRVFASSAYAPYRRIASGTPMDKPFDVYPQMRFLGEDFWRETLGIDGFAAFKTHFGNWHKITLAKGVKATVLNDRDPYRNLDQLQAVLATRSTRIGEDVVEALLPAKHYRRVFHDLTDEQRRAYDELKDECLTQLASGELVTAEHVLTMRLRLTQIGAGFLTPEAGADPVPFERNPRAEKLAELLHGLGPAEPTLIWTMFQHDARAVFAASRAAGRRPVIYDAGDPEGTLDEWKAGSHDDLIGNLGSGLTEGHTLVRARHCVYYTNTPRLIARAQSEKRVHRLGQAREVTYWDLLASETLDEANLEAVRRKAHWTGVVLGDDPRIAAAWLRSTLAGDSFDGSRTPEASAQGEIGWDEYEAAMGSMEV